MTKTLVGLLFGGRSGEHEVSIRSAQAIARAFQAAPNTEKYTILPIYIQKDGVWQGGDLAQKVLRTGQPLAVNEPPAADAAREIQVSYRQKLWQLPTEAATIDVWFPILHGPNGEDGTIQGLLALMQVPCVGSSVLGSAVGMDKIAMKTAFAQASIPQVKYRAVSRAEIWSDPCVYTHLLEAIETDLGYPCFVKPANLGSSVGIAKVRTREQLEAALDSAASYDRRIIVEAGVVAREVECAVLGSDRPKASVIGEITFDSDFYDYETKYTEGRAELKIPAPLPDAVTRKIQELAVQAFQAVDAAGLSRVDFFYEEATGNILINEINTLPGFTSTSMYPMLWEAAGVPFVDLVDQLVQLAQERYTPVH